MLRAAVLFTIYFKYKMFVPLVFSTLVGRFRLAPLPQYVFCGLARISRGLTSARSSHSRISILRSAITRKCYFAFATACFGILVSTFMCVLVRRPASCDFSGTGYPENNRKTADGLRLFVLPFALSTAVLTLIWVIRLLLRDA